MCVAFLVDPAQHPIIKLQIHTPKVRLKKVESATKN